MGIAGAGSQLEEAKRKVKGALKSLDLPFDSPEIRLEVVLWPATSGDDRPGSRNADPDEPVDTRA